MAGGKGERFWPKSRINNPKQFAQIISGKSMIEETVERFVNHDIADKKDIYISSGRQYKKRIMELFPNFPESNLILEPIGRDTAPCICLAVNQFKDDEQLLFVPADHFIDKTEEYVKNIKTLQEELNKKDGLMLMGIPPTEPSTAYGYIEMIAEAELKTEIRKVKAFKEKPKLNTAKHYLKTGHYLWNSGMFIFRSGFMKQAFRQHAPKLQKQITNYLRQDFYDEAGAKKVFSQIEKISFDYAIVEKLNMVYVLPAAYSWDDVGAWSSVARINGKDQNGNCLSGRSRVWDSKEVMVKNENDKQIVVLNGVSNLEIIVEKDVIYITKKEREAKIKNILKELGENNPEIL